MLASNFTPSVGLWRQWKRIRLEFSPVTLDALAMAE